MYMKQRKMKIEQRIKLNYMYITDNLPVVAHCQTELQFRNLEHQNNII